MRKIITISREFGSGGRELGKRLSDALSIPCYDHQIIETVAKNSSLSPEYVEKLSENDITSFYSATIGHSFISPNYAVVQSVQVAVAEHELIKKLASESDCIIVGRAADVVLAEYAPFNIFVCANEKSKIERCCARSTNSADLSDKVIIKKCKEIDKRRKAYYEMYSQNKWGDAVNYDLCINTSGKQIKMLIKPLVEYIKAWRSE